MGSPIPPKDTSCAVPNVDGVCGPSSSFIPEDKQRDYHSLWNDNVTSTTPAGLELIRRLQGATPSARGT